MKGTILVLTNNIRSICSFRREVMSAIVDAGYIVYISGMDNTDDDERIKSIEETGCKIIKTYFDSRGKNPIADYLLLLEYRNIIKHLKPQAVLTYTIKPNVYGGIACRMTNTPLIANVTGLGDAIGNLGWLQKLVVALYKIGLGKANQVFFQNSANRKFCIDHKIADNHSVLIPGSGVNLNYHTYQEYPPDGVIKFLFVTRLLKSKGTSEFLEMAETLKEKYPHTEFQILGWIVDNYQHKLEHLESKGIIKYLGITSDVRPFLKNVHATILPSYYHEGISNVNLESAANGRPVITTNIPGCRETVDDNITGFIVNERSVDDLIAGVERFILLPYNQKVLMGQNARKKVEQEFDRKIVVRAYLDCINHIKYPPKKNIKNIAVR